MDIVVSDTFSYYLSRTFVFLLSVRGLQFIVNKCKRRISDSEIPYAPHVPLLGSLPYLGRSPAQVIAKWHKQGQYGSIFRVKFGPMDAVVLNDYESIRQCYVRKGHFFSGRQQNSLVVELWKGDGLLFLDYGSKWKSQNKFRHQAFRRMFRDDKLQQMTINESRVMVKALKMHLRGEFTAEGFSFGNYKRVPMNCKKNECICTSAEADSNWTCVDPNNFAYRGSMNLNCRILFGRSFRSDETEYCGILADTPVKARKCSTAFMTAFLIPVLKHIPPIRGIINEGLDLRWATFKMIREIVDERVTRFNGVDENSDMIDMFIDRIVNKQGKDDDEYFTYSQLHAFLFDIFTAGAETSATTLLWALLYLSKYPDIQNELRCEIREFIGDSEDTCMSNLSKLHLTRATIHEVIRLRPIVTLGVPRKVTEDCEVMGFKFTKDTVVMPNLWSVHHNEEDFRNPEVFNPRRYIDGSGVFTPHNHVMGFAIGGRRCPGKPIAQSGLLCTLAQLIKNFEFRLPKVWNAKTQSYETAPFDFRGTNEQVLLTPEYWLQWREITEE